MTTPTTHHLIITDQHGKQIRRTVVYVKRLGPAGVAHAHVETQGVLQTGEYKAVYTTPSQSASGKYVVFSFGATAGQRWLSKGIFVRAKEPTRA